MGNIKFILIATACFYFLSFSVYGAEQKNHETYLNAKSDAFPIDESDWTVYMDAPNYHFALAKEYLQSGENAKAAAELNLGNSFLKYQKDRLALASKQLEELTAGISDGRIKDTSKLNVAITNALNVINNKYQMVPLEIEGSLVFENAYNYHFDKAKSKMIEGDRKSAALEIKKGAAFFKLKASQTSHLARTEIDAAINDLKKLASKVESGAVKDVKDLEQEFHKAVAVVSKKKE